MEIKKCERCGKDIMMLPWENICWDCQSQIELENIQNAINEAEDDEEIDTCSRDYVICPYCGNALETCVGYEDFPELYEDGEHTITCSECGKDFVLETSISYFYETHKKEGV